MLWYWWLIAGLLIGWLIEWVIDWFYWRARMRSYSETTTTLESEVRTLRSGRDQLDRDMQGLRGQYDQSVVGMKTLRGKYDQSQGLVASLRGEYDQSQGLVASLRADNERLAGELAEASKREAQLAELRLERDGMAGEMATLRQNGEQAEHTIASLRTDVDQLRHNLSEARKLEGQLTLAHTERDGLTAELGTLRGENERINSMLDSAKAEAALIVGMRTDNERMRTDNERMLAELADLHGMRERNTAEIEALQAQTQAISDARDELQREVLTLRAAPMQERELSGMQLGVADGLGRGSTFAGTMPSDISSFSGEQNSFTLGNAAAADGVSITGGEHAFDGDAALVVGSSNERDPLIDIDGIGPVYQQKLFDSGVTSFAQLSAMSPAQIREIIAPEAWQEFEPELWIAEAREFAARRDGGNG